MEPIVTDDLTCLREAIKKLIEDIMDNSYIIANIKKIPSGTNTINNKE